LETKASQLKDENHPSSEESE